MQYCSLLNHSQVYRIQRGKVLQGENQRPLEYPDPEGLILLRNQSQSRARAALRPAASRLARHLWERGLQIGNSAGCCASCAFGYLGRWLQKGLYVAQVPKQPPAWLWAVQSSSRFGCHTSPWARTSRAHRGLVAAPNSHRGAPISTWLPHCFVLHCCENPQKLYKVELRLGRRAHTLIF